MNSKFQELVFFLKNKNFIQIEKITLKGLKENPNDCDMNFFYALVLTQKKEFDIAIIHFEKSMTHERYQNDSYFNLGGCFQAASEYHKAIKYYSKCIDQKFKLVDTYIRIAECYRYLRNYDYAIEMLLKSIDIQKNIKAYFLLGNIYREIGNFNEARKSFNNSLVLDKNFYKAKLSIANLNIDEGNYKHAFDDLEKIIIKNELPLEIKLAAKIDLANLFKNQGKYSEAIKIYLEVLKQSPKNASASYNLSLSYFFIKNFEKAWQLYEERMNLNIFGQLRSRLKFFKKEMWNNKMPKKDLLIWGEQGIGDVILHSQILETIKNEFSNLTLAVDKKLIPFFEKIFPSINLIDIEKLINFKDYKYHLPIGSLGLFFHKKIIEYSFAYYPNYFIKNNIVPEKIKKLRIGISWQSTNKIFGHKKSIDLLKFKKLFSNKNLEFLNLQFKTKIEEIKNLEKKLGYFPFVKNSIDCFNDIDGVASLIKSCDIIISISNTNAHIAGKLGIKTFLLLPFNDGKLWYWGTNNDSNILWYPSIKPLRQTVDGNWTTPLKLLNSEIEKLL